ncbi:hypothetical protein L227DRAFT_273539 [Lentinus tigrinus ALCF2SS1-6]|uniref:Uncharacterized protein n=1 Tax=Lentinus tigrinus ALCF2SS1-6 TaxID=1328759 RepID=A0A5C2SPA4_9APHY|nr:hypothetical protein L227DRAFT_273539 [Lentinus tigrinus ALCF2SS1-6]
MRRVRFGARRPGSRSLCRTTTRYITPIRPDTSIVVAIALVSSAEIWTLHGLFRTMYQKQFLGMCGAWVWP